MSTQTKEVQLSIIIPVYNVEDYLEKCLMSCMNIGLPISSYEVIVVNDGSPDNSLAIANRLAAKYNNIKIYSKENGGLSSARNYGLERAKGSYIWFFDSDDYVVITTLNKVIRNAIKADLDILFFNWLKVMPNGSLVNNDNQFKLDSDTSVMSGYQVFDLLNGMYFAPRFIFKKDLFENKKFEQGMYYEDIHLIPELLISSKKVQGYKTTLFHYLQRSGSILNSKNTKLVTDSLAVSIKYKKLSNLNVKYLAVSKAAAVSSLHNAVRLGSSELINEVLCFLKENKLNNIYSGQGLRYKIYNLILCLSPKLLVHLISLNQRRKFD